VTLPRPYEAVAVAAVVVVVVAAMHMYYGEKKESIYAIVFYSMPRAETAAARH
jgi:hypothetical protein